MGVIEVVEGDVVVMGWDAIIVWMEVVTEVVVIHQMFILVFDIVERSVGM